MKDRNEDKRHEDSLTEHAEIAEIKAISKGLSEEYFGERKKFFSEFSVGSSEAGERQRILFEFVFGRYLRFSSAISAGLSEAGER